MFPVQEMGGDMFFQANDTMTFIDEELKQPKRPLVYQSIEAIPTDANKPNLT